MLTFPKHTHHNFELVHKPRSLHLRNIMRRHSRAARKGTRKSDGFASHSHRELVVPFTSTRHGKLAGRLLQNFEIHRKEQWKFEQTPNLFSPNQVASCTFFGNETADTNAILLQFPVAPWAKLLLWLGRLENLSFFIEIIFLFLR